MIVTQSSTDLRNSFQAFCISVCSFSGPHFRDRFCICVGAKNIFGLAPRKVEGEAPFLDSQWVIPTPQLDVMFFWSDSGLFPEFSNCLPGRHRQYELTHLLSQSHRKWLRRRKAQGNWQKLCYPFRDTAIDGLKIYKIWDFRIDEVWFRSFCGRWSESYFFNCDQVFLGHNVSTLAERQRKRRVYNWLESTPKTILICCASLPPHKLL